MERQSLFQKQDESLKIRSSIAAWAGILWAFSTWAGALPRRRRKSIMRQVRTRRYAWLMWRPRRRRLGGRTWPSYAICPAGSAWPRSGMRIACSKSFTSSTSLRGARRKNTPRIWRNSPRWPVGTVPGWHERSVPTPSEWRSNSGPRAADGSRAVGTRATSRGAPRGSRRQDDRPASPAGKTPRGPQRQDGGPQRQIGEIADDPPGSAAGAPAGAGGEGAQPPGATGQAPGGTQRSPGSAAVPLGRAAWGRQRRAQHQILADRGRRGAGQVHHGGPQRRQRQGLGGDGPEGQRARPSRSGR